MSRITRGLAVLALGAASVTLAVVAPRVGAQQPSPSPARVGFLGLASPELGEATVFRDELRRLGWTEGQNLLVDERWAGGRNERFPELAAELVRMNPAVIVSPCGPALAAIRRASRTVPVVSHCVDAKNFLGEVASLARPGANTTGFLYFGPEAAGKRLQLLKEAVPGIERVAVLHSAEDWSMFWAEIRPAAKALGIALVPVVVRTPEELARALAALTRDRVDALTTFTDATLWAERQRIAAFALERRIATIHEFRAYPIAGALMSYGAAVGEVMAGVAGQVDRILRGARPADLPVQQPTRLHLVINLKTAKALGLTVPPAVLQQADEILQ